MTRSMFYHLIEPNTLCYLWGTTCSFDLDLPADCDDEYWTSMDGGIPFRQPPGIPSSITFFNLSHRLDQIASFAMRTIVSSLHDARIALTLGLKYSINRSKVLLGYVGPQWQQTIVAQLDSALNKWVDSIPDHCKPFYSTPTTNSSFIFQCAGTLQGKMAYSSINLQFSTPIITKRKSSSTGHSYLNPINLHCFPFPPWPSAQTLPGPAAI